MRRHLSYANVMATLGVFIALGGTSYAAIKITGKNVRNGSLTGLDIKKRSVGLDRLKGSPPTAPAGATGPSGPAGVPGPKGDPGAPAPAEGVTRLAEPPGQWISADPELVGELSATTLDLEPSSPAGFGFVTLHPQLPVTTAAGRMKVLAVRICTSSPAGGSEFSSVFVTQSRNPDYPADIVANVEFTDPPQDPTCERYGLAAPFVLEGDDALNVRIRIDWTSASSLSRIGHTTIEYERVP